MTTKADQIIEMVDKQGLSITAAAKTLGVHRSLYYIVKKRRAARGVCPTCGQMLPKGWHQS